MWQKRTWWEEIILQRSKSGLDPRQNGNHGPMTTIDEALLRPGEPGYTACRGNEEAMRAAAVIVAAIAAVAVQAGSAAAAPRNGQQVVERSAAGTIIQPTKTIIHHEDGTTTVIVIPRRRSYLDTGTEVSVGDRSFMDYAFPPGGDPGRPNWFIGPDTGGGGRYPLPGFGSIPGYNPDTPF
jgi:hypothetical protein